VWSCVYLHAAVLGDGVGGGEGLERAVQPGLLGHGGQQHAEPAPAQQRRGTRGGEKGSQTRSKRELAVIFIVVEGTGDTHPEVTLIVVSPPGVIKFMPRPSNRSAAAGGGEAKGLSNMLARVKCMHRNATREHFHTQGGQGAAGLQAR
jgi:hypothetical protein